MDTKEIVRILKTAANMEFESKDGRLFGNGAINCDSQFAEKSPNRSPTADAKDVATWFFGNREFQVG